MEKRECSNCNNTFEMTEQFFYKSKGGTGGLNSWCKSCCKIYSANRYKEKSKGQFRQIRKEELLSDYPSGSIEREIHVHFYRLGLELNPTEISIIKKRLNNAELIGKYFSEFDKIESEYGVGPEDYTINFSEILRQSRKEQYELRWPSTGGVDDVVPVQQFDMDGNFIAEYASMSDASEILTGNRSKSVGGISSTCKGLTRHALGFIWDFKNKF